MIELRAKLKEEILRWMVGGHVYRREDSYVGKRMKSLVVGRKKRGKPKRRWHGVTMSGTTSSGIQASGREMYMYILLCAILQ